MRRDRLLWWYFADTNADGFQGWAGALPVVMAVVPKCLLAGSPADSRSTIRDAIRISNDQAAQALPFRGYKALLIRKPTSSETAAAFSNVNHLHIFRWSLLPLQLRYLQTLNSISAENNSTIIFPVRTIADTTSSTIMKVYMYWSISWSSPSSSS